MNRKKGIEVLFVLCILLLAGVVSASHLYGGSNTIPTYPKVNIANLSDYDVEKITYFFLNQEPDPVEPGDIVEIRIKVENTGDDEIRGMVFELLPEYPFTLLPGDTPFRSLGNLHAEQLGRDAFVLRYKLKVDEHAVEGDNTIRFRYFGKVPGAGNTSVTHLSEPHIIKVRSEEALLEVQEASTTPRNVAPGEQFVMTLSFKNIANSALKNLRAVLDLNGQPIAPFQSTNEQVKKLLQAGDAWGFTYKLIAEPDAKATVHKPRLSIYFTDELGNQFSLNKTIGIVVKDTPHYSVNLEESEVFTSDQKGKILMSVSNIGNAEMRFTQLDLLPSEGYEILGAASIYLGNLESDDFETAEYTIYNNGNHGDTLELQFRITYKDNYNTIYQNIVPPVSISLYSKEEAQRFGLLPKQNNTQLYFGLVIFIVLTVFWLFMLAEAIKQPMVRYKKFLWLLLLISTHVIGAVIYYFIEKKKGLGSQ